MALAFMELAAEKIRARVGVRAQEAMRNPVPVPPQPRAAGIPAFVPPVTPEPVSEPEIPEVPEPGSREECKPNAVLWHTTESDGYEEGEPETVPVRRPPAPQPVAEAVPVRLPAPCPAPVVQQPSWRQAAMRSMTAEETWGALTDVISVGDGTSKARGKLSRDDLRVIIARFDSEKREHAKRLAEVHEEGVKARRELDALRRHGAELIEELPDYELDRLYGQRAA